MRALVILCVLSAVAFADTPQELYREGRYAEAAQQFAKAYASDPRPEYLFNAAQSFRLAKDCANAATYYKKFLAAAPADTPNLERVRGYVAEMDACVKAGQPAEPAPQPPPPPPPSPVDPAISPATEPAPPVDDHHSIGPAVGVGVGVAGLAAVGAGLYFQHEVSVAEGDRAACSAANPCTLDKRASIDARGRRNETRAIVSYSIGGAAIATGVVLYVVGHKHPAAEHVTVVPLPGGAAAGVGYSF